MAEVVSGPGCAAVLLVGLLASGAVWLAGHAIDVLVLLSPFAPLDGLLRTARLAVGGLVEAQRTEASGSRAT